MYLYYASVNRISRALTGVSGQIGTPKKLADQAARRGSQPWEQPTALQPRRNHARPARQRRGKLPAKLTRALCCSPRASDATAVWQHAGQDRDVAGTSRIGRVQN